MFRNTSNWKKMISDRDDIGESVRIHALNIVSEIVLLMKNDYTICELYVSHEDGEPNKSHHLRVRTKNTNFSNRDKNWKEAYVSNQPTDLCQEVINIVSEIMEKDERRIVHKLHNKHEFGITIY